jgi:hypothetical protein
MNIILMLLQAVFHAAAPSRSGSKVASSQAGNGANSSRQQGAIDF